jgi:hypothetical protein
MASSWPITASAAVCNDTCGCYEREVCPELYDATADRPAVWTCIELLVISALFWMQGLGPLEIPSRLCHRLRVALTGPIDSDEAAAQLLGGHRPRVSCVALADAARLLGVFVAGSAGLQWIGFSSGFLCQPPNIATLTSSGALFTLPVPLFFPGLVEECFWRFMVLPAPREERMSGEERRTFAAREGAPAASPRVRTAGWSVQHLLALLGFVAYHLDAVHSEPRRAAWPDATSCTAASAPACIPLRTTARAPAILQLRQGQ